MVDFIKKSGNEIKFLVIDERSDDVKAKNKPILFRIIQGEIFFLSEFFFFLIFLNFLESFMKILESSNIYQMYLNLLWKLEKF